jgi:glycerol-3-phosphate dehydrogenase
MTASSLDFRDRARAFAALEEKVFDLVVIGAGITGAGIARDAAMRGLSVALVEARDIASGTSSRSSKMIHGGLRYMAQGDLGLVQEAASERKILERIAPHLTRLTPFVIPANSPAGIAKLQAGLWAFEKLGAVPKDRRHEVWSRRELTAREPAFDASATSGAVVYPEYLTNDARLTLANARSAAAHGAQVITYAPVQSLIVEAGRVCGALIGDALSAGGARVRGRLVVNAAGPWVDAIRRLEDPAAPARLQLTKGVHLVVAHARLPVSRTIIIPAADRRSVFAAPKGDFTYLGTTDTFYPQETYWPAIDAADGAYLLEACAARFTAPPGVDDVLAAWSGVRPLVGEPGKQASEISRRDEIWTGPGGMLSIAGGKLTAYRRMAERIVDIAEETLGRTVRPPASADVPLVGGDLDTDAAIAAHGERLVGLYGAEAGDVAGGPVAEARHGVLREGALTLEDFWVRRSGRAWFDVDGGVAALAPAAAEMARLLGWSDAFARAQIDACLTLRQTSLAGLRAAPYEKA